MYQRDKAFEKAQHHVEKSLKYFRVTGDILGQALTLTLAESIENRQGNNMAARNSFEEALVLCRQSGNQSLLVIILNRLGDHACYESLYDFATALFEECLEISIHLNDRSNQAILLNNLGTIRHNKDGYAQTTTYYFRCLEMCRKIGDRDGVALALNNLGELSTAQEDYSAALKYSQDALRIAEQLQETWTIIVCLNSLGKIYCALGQLKKAKVTFCPQSARLWKSMALTWSPG